MIENLERISKEGMKFGALVGITGCLLLGYNNLKYSKNKEQVNNSMELKETFKRKTLTNIYTGVGGLCLFSVSYLGYSISQFNRQRKESEQKSSEEL